MVLSGRSPLDRSIVFLSLGREPRPFMDRSPWPCAQVCTRLVGKIQRRPFKGRSPYGSLFISREGIAALQGRYPLATIPSVEETSLWVLNQILLTPKSSKNVDLSIMIYNTHVVTLIVFLLVMF